MTDPTPAQLKADMDSARAFYAAALDRSRYDYDWHGSAAAAAADAAWIAVTKAEDAYEEALEAQEKTNEREI
jgi:hypothetical protein